MFAVWVVAIQITFDIVGIKITLKSEIIILFHIMNNSCGKSREGKFTRLRADVIK